MCDALELFWLVDCVVTSVIIGTLGVVVTACEICGHNCN